MKDQILKIIEHLEKSLDERQVDLFKEIKYADDHKFAGEEMILRQRLDETNIARHIFWKFEEQIKAICASEPG